MCLWGFELRAGPIGTLAARFAGVSAALKQRCGVGVPELKPLFSRSQGKTPGLAQ